jgi:rubrerythrin
MKLDDMVVKAIHDEQEAIDLYNAMLPQLELTNQSKYASIVKVIRDQEMDHKAIFLVLQEFLKK